MAFEINELIAESNREFAESARRLIQSESSLTRLRRMRDNAPGFEKLMWSKLADAGWISAIIPEQRGGLGLGLDASAAIATVIGETPIPEPYAAAAVIPVLALLEIAPSDSVDDLLRRIAQGELICGLAWQEKAGELNVSDVATRLTPEDSLFRLRGRKKWVSPGNGADGWLVPCSQDGEDILVWVDRNDEGVKVQSVRRIDGSFMAHLTFDVVVSRERILASGSTVRLALDKALDAGRFVVSHELLGVSARVFNITLEYLKTREQFGRPIGANQALQHRMVDAYMHILLLSASLKETWTAYYKGDITLSAMASLVKARANQVAVSVSSLAVQLHGAIGYTDELDVGIYLKRALNL
ncbi:MAG: acyl-CoA dehydrogenase family protein, partial [Advenella sp.]